MQIFRRRRWWHCVNSIYWLTGCQGGSTVTWSGPNQEEVVVCYSICCFGTFDQVVRDMQVAEARIGRLSSSQREFITLQSEKNSLVEMGRKRKRSNEEDALLRRVQIKLKNRRRDMSDYDDRLIIKPKSSAKSGAQRVAKTRASQGKKSDSTGAERQARRRSGWSRQRVEKEMEEDRVRKVSKRAGGLSQARKEDVRVGQRKNKDTAVRRWGSGWWMALHSHMDSCMWRLQGKQNFQMLKDN